MLKRPQSPADLPASVPVFPLSGALLLPYSRRPLNIFEPRYIEMIDHALKGDRLIGLIQPRDTSVESPQGRAPLERIGTVGRLVQFEEVDEGRYFVILEGLSRFDRMQHEERAVWGRLRALQMGADALSSDDKAVILAALQDASTLDYEVRLALRQALEVWKDVTFNYASTDTPDFVPTATAAE